MSDIKEKVESELKTVKSLCETMENAIKTQIDKGLDKVNTHEMYEAVDIYKDLSEVKKNIIEGCYKMQVMEAMEESGEDEEEGGEEVRYYRGQPRSRRTGRFMSRSGRRGYEPMYPEEYYRDMDRFEGRMYYNGGGSSGGGGGQSGGSSGGSGGSSGGSSSGGSGGSRGYSEGYSEGQNRGYEEGNRRGYEEGNRRGYEEGNRRGYSEGNQRGYEEGYNRGYSEGQRSGGNSGGGRSGSRSENARRNYEETKAMHNTNTAEDKQQKVKMLEKYVNELSSDIMSMMSDSSNEEKTMLKTKLTNLANKIV